MQPDDNGTLDELTDEEESIEIEIDVPLTDSEIEIAYATSSLRVIYQSNNYFLPQIRDLINAREVINLRPEYQRRLRWSNKKKSLLIESLLLNIPVPPIFLYESDLARYEVMDGQQRLNAIHDFLENNFPLTRLEKLTFLNGRRYNELPPRVRRGLDRSSVSAIVLLQETKSDATDPFLVRRYVFERLNTGGVTLNAQEIRNSIFRGSFNDLVVRLSRNNTFCKIFGIPLYTETDENDYYENPDRQKNTLYRKMNDCQIILRFFALQNDDFIRGSMKSILDSCMRRNATASSNDLENFESQFNEVIDGCSTLFNGAPFLLPPDESGRQRLSIGLYDSCMAAVFRNKDNLPKILANRNDVAATLDALVKGNLELFTGRSNTAQSIRNRIDAVNSILRDI